jgi:hypothetical protein
MAVVQDPSIDRAMHEFAALVDTVENKQLDRKELGIHSYHLGRKCYESLKDSWDQPFSKQASPANLTDK